MYLLRLSLCLWLGSAALVRAQAPIPDPDFPRDYAETRGFSLGKPTGIVFAPDGKSILFRRSTARDFEHNLFAYDVATGEERLLLSADVLLGGDEEKLSEAEKARRERMRMTARGISGFRVSDDGAKLLTSLSGSLYVLDRGDGTVQEIASESGYPIGARFSPDASKIAVVRGEELYVHDLAEGTERRLTNSPEPHISNGVSEFVAQEEMGRMEGFWWSPDGARLAYQETDTSPVETLYIADAVNPERVPQSWPYPRAGTDNAIVRLGIIGVGGGETTWVEWDREAFPYLVNVRWNENCPMTVTVQNRAQTVIRLLRVEPDTGATALLHEETDDAWLNIDQQMPKWLPDGRGFLWTTERNGGEQLELRSADGGLVRALTETAFGYHSLVSLHEDGGSVIVRASDDPTQSHVYRVDLLEDSEPEALSAGPGTHSMIFARDHSSHAVQHDSLEGESAHEVYRADGSRSGALSSVNAKPGFEADIELTTAGELGMHVAIVRPRDFDASKRYPVIESVYGGPSGPMVTQDRSRYRSDQWLADQGFIVVKMDGRGTLRRGREWSRAIHDDFVSVPLEDHVNALRALGERYPEMDMERVGVHGWSFGGYFSAMAVMRFPEVYRAGIAGAPVVDWRDYDTHYTERFIGHPKTNAAAYDVSNVLTYAEQLTRPLLIIHGTTDDNVYFMHSLKLSSALYAAGIDHEFLPLTNFTHMVADPRVATRRMELTARFFGEHLGGE